MSETTNYRLAGILWLTSVITVFASLVIVLQYDITLNSADIEKALVNVSRFAAAHVGELILDELSYVALIALAAPMYILFRRFDTTLALMGSLLLTAGGIVGAVHDMGNFAVTQIAAAYVNATASDAAMWEIATLATTTTAKYGISIGGMLIALGAIAYNGLMLLRQAGPRWLAIFGLVANALVFVAVPIGWMDPALEGASYGLYVPFLAWQVTFGIWLLRQK